MGYKSIRTPSQVNMSDGSIGNMVVVYKAYKESDKLFSHIAGNFLWIMKKASNNDKQVIARIPLTERIFE